MAITSTQIMGATGRPQLFGIAPRACNGAGDRVRRACGTHAVCGLHWESYCFGVVGPAARLQVASLVARMYGRQGYRCDHDALPQRTSHGVALAAAHGEHLVATLTVGLDGPAGLLADALYRRELRAFRRPGQKLCELTQFAVDPTHSSPRLLACLFQTAYLYGRLLHRVTDVFIEVNPRHASFYQRLLNFRRVGDVRECPRVQAPAVLLHLDANTLDAGEMHQSEAKEACPAF